MTSARTSMRNYFNSRPREGADGDNWGANCKKNISTHGPARGPTRAVAQREQRKRISTHGPARGPTEDFKNLIHFTDISTHGPARGPTEISCYYLIERAFQLTAPRGGRPGTELHSS